VTCTLDLFFITCSPDSWHFSFLQTLHQPPAVANMAEPLSDLSPSKQNSRSKLDHQHKSDRFQPRQPVDSTHTMSTVIVAQSPRIAPGDLQLPTFHPPSPTRPTSSQANSPKKAFSPIKYRLQDESQVADSPPDSPAERTMRFNEGLTRAIGGMQKKAPEKGGVLDDDDDAVAEDVTRSIEEDLGRDDMEDETTEFTLSIDDKVNHDDTVGDLSTISAIPPDLTRFAGLRNSPTKTGRADAWSPSKQLRNSIMLNTPGTTQRPLHLLSGSRQSTSSNEDDEATPRRARGFSGSPTDLMNFTGQSNVLFPPPGSAPRTSRRSPSGRGAFPIKVNPSPSHRSQASLDRERAGGRSPPKPQQERFPEKSLPATPAGQRHGMYSGSAGLGMDLLDIDLEPMATPRSIPTITPRELETLRSELQSRISGLEATLSGKEAEVMALKRAITDAELRVGKTSEELRTERAAREESARQKSELERRSREMEDVLREVKQNAFVEEREKEKLRRQAEEAERKTEEHEVKILELRASLDALRAERMKSTPSPQKTNAHPATPGLHPDIDLAVKDATEKVARELHALYKSKHERKVADLKVSYEKRWIKQVDQLRAELKASQDEVVKLQTEKEATMSSVIPGQSEAISKMEGQVEELRRWNDEISVEKKVLEAEVAGLKGQVDSFTAETESLRKEIEQERVEKGELVAQVDLFLTMSAQQEEQRAAPPPQPPVSPPRSEDGRPTSAAAIASPNRVRTGLSGRPRPMSMLQKPTAGKFSGIPAPGPSLKAPSSNAGRGLGYGGRSGGIMEGIARMGAGGR